MSTTIKIAVLLIFAIQIFVAGRTYEDQRVSNMTLKEWVSVLLQIALICLLYVPAYLIVSISGFLYQKVWVELHLNFILTYVILKKPLLEYSDAKQARMLAKVKEMKPKWYELAKHIEIRLIFWINRHYENKK